MRVSLFDFTLPPEQIAHYPAQPRESARLLHVDGAALTDHCVGDLPSLIGPHDILVFNDSRVIPARLFAQVNGRTVEVLLHKEVASGQLSVVSKEREQGKKDSGILCSSPLEGERELGGSFSDRASSMGGIPLTTDDSPLTTPLWQAFARPARKLKTDMELTFGEGFTATVEGRTEDGQVLLRFALPRPSLMEMLRRDGHMPLPPYIARADEAADARDYQTIYARADGSVAAPTAGLHFTPALMDALHARGVQTAYVTLHVGAGTFQPVKVEDTAEHVMHDEGYAITQEAVDAIARARAAGGKVVAVGTTSLRILESVADDAGNLRACSGETGIFITPGYRFKIVDRLMTNFHLPKSTLFMLTCAFAGLEPMQAAYAHAIATGYRFYSYGDTSLLERAAPLS